MAHSHNTNHEAKHSAQAARVFVWDGWRGLAIFFVLCGHFYNIEWLWEDRFGVDVFFVLSGMLMSSILFEKRMSLKDFYIRRLSRIFPVLLVYLVAVFVFTWLYTQEFNFNEFIASLFFMRTYLPVDPHIWSSEVPIGHLWSLNVEEHAYIVLSVISIILINRKYIAWLLLALGLTSVALSFYHYINLTDEAFSLQLIRTESAIVFIFLSAGYGLLKRKNDWQVHPFIAPACFLGALTCYIESMPVWMIFSIGPVLLSVAVNHLDNLPTTIKGLLSFLPLRYLGIYSYSIYLWQQFFFEYLWAFPLGKPLVLVLAILTGVISFHIIENPIRHFINSRWSTVPTYRKIGKHP